jgi:cytochrome d ubiquinol oxidase subunit I
VLDNLTAAREQMAFSLGFHIIFAVFGMGLPWLLLFVEYRWIRTGDEDRAIEPSRDRSGLPARG